MLGQAPAHVVVAFDAGVAVTDANLIQKDAGLLVPHPCEPGEPVARLREELRLFGAECRRILAEGVEQQILCEARRLDELHVVAGV